MDKKKVTLDDILDEQCGHFGPFQLRLLILVFVYSLLIALVGSGYVFTTARVRTRCLIPECEEIDPEFSPSWLLNAIPGTSHTSFESCLRYENRTAGGNLDLTCPVYIFDQTVTKNCEHRVYENQNTIVYDFDLGCSEWHRSFVGSARSIGSLIGLPISGFVSDRWGRKPVIIMSVVNLCLFGCLKFWANSYWTFISLEFIEAIFATGSSTGAFVLLQEVFGRHRSITGPINFTSSGIGGFILALMAMYIENWKYLTLAIYLPFLFILCVCWLFPESIKWLWSKQRYDEAIQTIKRIGKANGRELPDDVLSQLNDLRFQQEKEKILEENKINEWLPILVFKHKTLLLRTIICPILWISLVLTYHGLSLNAVSLSGNIYINYMLVSAAEIPGFLGSAYLLTVFRRKLLITIGFFFCGSCMILFILLPSDMFWLSLAVYMFAKLIIAVVASTIYVYTSEIFPTSYRSTLFGYCSMIGRIGNISATLTPALGDLIWTELPYVLFAGFTLLSGSLMLFMPETKGLKLPDTIEEANNMGKMTKGQNKISKL